MKKGWKKIISVILISLTLVISIFALNAFADSPTEYESCADYYFSNLTGDDVPYNVSGSCGYVATSILLAYYDAYWNDDFVPDEYDQDSTFEDGVFVSSTIKSESDKLVKLYEIYKEGGGTLRQLEFLKTIYHSFVADNLNKGYLHLDLIGMGIDAGYYSGILQNSEYSIDIPEIATILDDYFDDIFGEYNYYDPLGLNSIFGENPPIKIKILDSTSIGKTHDDVINKMHELLKNDIPVMYRGYRIDIENNNEKVGHVLIAYDPEIDANGNVVDCKLHTGWRSSPFTIQWENNNYDLGTAILWFEIDESRIPHKCSNNYTIGDDRFCSCEVYGDLHPEHTHELGEYLTFGTEGHHYRCKWDDTIKTESHTFTYQQVSNTSHLAICECGYTIEQSHSGGFYTYHDATCKCGYSYTTPHQYIYQQVTEDSHTAACACGYTYTITHQFDLRGESEDYHSATCECGYSYEAPHTLEFRPAYDVESNHALACACGYMYATPHQYTYQQVSETSHRATCECGYSYEEAHGLVQQQLSSEAHIFVCECGYSYEEAHNLLCGQLSEIHHQLLCECGYRYEEEHDLVEQDYHTSTCDDCGYIHTTPHNSSSYQQSSDTHHLVNCGCGYVGEAPHIFTCTSVSSTVHRLTCECGYTALESHNFRQTSNPRYYSCTKCGYTRDNFGPGGNIQMGVNKEEETE